MDQEKFVGKYIELLNVTLTEAIQKNIVAQAQKTVLETDIKGFEQRIEEIRNDLETRLTLKQKEVDVLKSELNTVRQQLGVANTNAHEANVAKQHFETFKNELAVCRKENDDLKALIAQKDEEIAKYKPAPEPVVINKIGKKNTPSTETKVIKVKSVKDAGSF